MHAPDPYHQARPPSPQLHMRPCCPCSPGRFLLLFFETLTYFTAFGMLCVALVPSVAFANVVGSFAFGYAPHAACAVRAVHAAHAVLQP